MLFLEEDRADADCHFRDAGKECVRMLDAEEKIPHVIYRCYLSDISVLRKFSDCFIIQIGWKMRINK